MTTQEIAANISQRFGAKIIASFPEDKHPRVPVDAETWRELAEFLLRDPSLKLDWLQCLSGVDYVADDKMCCVYDLYSFDLKHVFAVKVFCPRDTPEIPSVADFWPAADWHEREAYDMFGIIFSGHPDLRRILCADDWEGFPLRKDYVFPREYHGIPASVELDWQQQPDYPK
ncbi:NADH-quinone oxidoreductase subunit C [soil metagenome]